MLLSAWRGQAQLAEQLVQEASPDATIVRCSWFAQNFSEAFLAGPVAAGELRFPARDVREPFVDAEDIADVAAAALSEPGHEGRVYELTGPRLLTFAEAVGEIARATGREIRYVPVSVEEYTGSLHGEPEEVAELVRTSSPRCWTAATSGWRWRPRSARPRAARLRRVRGGLR